MCDHFGIRFKTGFWSYFQEYSTLASQRDSFLYSVVQCIFLAPTILFSSNEFISNNDRSKLFLNALIIVLSNLHKSTIPGRTHSTLGLGNIADMPMDQLGIDFILFSALHRKIVVLSFQRKARFLYQCVVGYNLVSFWLKDAPKRPYWDFWDWYNLHEYKQILTITWEITKSYFHS